MKKLLLLSLLVASITIQTHGALHRFTEAMDQIERFIERYPILAPSLVTGAAATLTVAGLQLLDKKGLIDDALKIAIKSPVLLTIATTGYFVLTKNLFLDFPLYTYCDHRNPCLRLANIILMLGANPNYIHGPLIAPPLMDITISNRKVNTKTATLLLKYGANINYQDSYDNTILSIAAEQRSYDTFKFFVENGADITTVHRQGETLLHLAAKSGSKEIVQLLLSKSKKSAAR